MTPEERKALRHAHRQASRGRWSMCDGVVRGGLEHERNILCSMDQTHGCSEPDQFKHNAWFVVQAHRLVPACLDALDEAEKRTEAAEVNNANLSRALEQLQREYDVGRMRIAELEAKTQELPPWGS